MVEGVAAVAAWQHAVAAERHVVAAERHVVAAGLRVAAAELRVAAVVQRVVAAEHFAWVGRLCSQQGYFVFWALCSGFPVLNSLQPGHAR